MSDNPRMVAITWRPDENVITDYFGPIRYNSNTDQYLEAKRETFWALVKSDLPIPADLKREVVRSYFT